MDTADVSAVRARLDGEFVIPGDPEWDEARQAWNLAVAQHPAAVAVPESAADVVAVVEFAREHELRVAPQGTGHAAAPMGSLRGTVLVKTHLMRGVQIDPRGASRARRGRGALG